MTAAAQSKFIPDGTARGAENEPEAVVLADTFADAKAVISNVTGTAKILRSGTDEWTTLVEGDVLQEGDQIRTDGNSSVDIVYDESSLNTAHIEENSIVEYRGLEPTFVYLADGSICNSLEALPEGQEYEVATDTAVNAIRGTKFLRSFNAANQTDSTVVADGSVESFSVLPDGSKGEESIVIQKDNALTVTPELLRVTPFSQLRPLPSDFEIRKKISGLENDFQKRLGESVGGPEALKEHRKRALEHMEQPEFHQAFHNKRREMMEIRREAMMKGRGPGFTKPRSPDQALPAVPGEEIKPGELPPAGQEEFRPTPIYPGEPKEFEKSDPDQSKPDDLKRRPEPGHNQHHAEPKPTGGGQRPPKGGPKGGGAPGPRH